MAKDYARPFYDSQDWKDTRQAYMHSQNYICEACGGAASLVHHIQAIKPWNVADPTITLDWGNLKAVCEKCHTEEHAQDQRYRNKAARLNGITFDDEGNAVKSPNVFLVCGSPASGKTTYVADHKTTNDLVMDLDYICAALMGELANAHAEHRAVLAVALEVRELLYKIIQERRGKWARAFVISTIASVEDMRAVASELQAELVILDTPLDECVRRIRNDPSRAKHRKLFERLAVEWSEKYLKSLERIGGAIPPHIAP